MDRLHVQYRAEVEGRKLHGYASVFDQATRIGRSYEVIAPTAFRSVLKRDPDVRALWNHDENHLLGRTSSGTVRLWTDSVGLGYEVDLPDTQLGHDVRELARRGDITGSSFGFIPGEDEIAHAADGLQVRTHTDIRELRDVSPVTFPAYEGASVELRSLTIVQPNVRLLNHARLIRARHTKETYSK